MRGVAAADEPRRDLFGLDEPRDAPATCATAESLPCPVDRRPDARADDDAAASAWVTRITRAQLARLPLATGDLDSAAGLAVGAGRDDGGIHYAGATSADNRYLLGGAAIDSPRFGSLDTRVPLAFVDELVITTGGFSARDRAATGAVIDARLREGGDEHVRAAGLWLGVGAPPRLTEPVRGEYRSFHGRIADRRSLDGELIADGPLGRAGGARLWYAAGIAPRLADGTLLRRAWRRADRDGDGAADEDAAGLLVHEPIGTAERGALTWSVPVMARGGARAEHHHLAATALVSTAGDTRWISTAESNAAGVDRRALDATLALAWRGDWGATRARLDATWMRQARTESPHAAAGAAPDIGLAYIPPPDGAVAAPGGPDDAVRAACADGGDGDDYPDFFNCSFPIGYYHVGGAGQLFDVTTDRPGVHGEVSRTFGAHTVALGGGGEDTRVVVRTRFTGGFMRRQLGDDAYIDYRFVEIGTGPGFDDVCGDGITCDWLDEHERAIRTRHVAAWLADTWRPGDDITVELGVRAESSQIGESLEVRDVLPRLGAAWDFLGGGRSRLFAGWGRYAAVLPAATGERLFAGPIIHQQRWFGGVMSDALAQSSDLPIAPDVRGVRVDEALAGVEVGLADVARAGLVARHRRLGRTLEDVEGTLVTPGTDGGAAATRAFTEVGVTLENAPTAELHVRAGYAWSRLRGNWPGAYDPVDGFGLYLSSAFDGDPAAVNATGPLPNDQPHRFFAEVAGRGHAGGFAIDASVRATAASGRPLSVRTTGGQVFLLERGAAGRLPTVAQTNARVAARRGRFTVSLDVLNVFDRRGTVASDEVFVLDDLTPISGGDASDLVWLKDNVQESNPARLNRRYGAPSRFQAPLLALLGVRVDL